MILSSWSTTSIEEVAASPNIEEEMAATGNGSRAQIPGLQWFQLYVYRDLALTTKLVHRAEQAGYKALVVTVDTPILGRRLLDARNKFNLPTHLKLANFDEDTSSGSSAGSGGASKLVTKLHDSGLHQYTKEQIDPSMDWDKVDWLCTQTHLPVILKGILTREDVREALRHKGIRGIVVSNHGARQLDGVPATVRQCPKCLHDILKHEFVLAFNLIHSGTLQIHKAHGVAGCVKVCILQLQNSKNSMA